MTSQTTDPPPSDDTFAGAYPLPGWWGKLPGMGDFAHRRLPDAFRLVWDRWLQAGLTQMRNRHPDWQTRYLSAPLWCFVLGEGVIGEGAWMGVLMPSVDAVGRYFPFTVVGAMAPSPPELEGQLLTHARYWMALAAQCAIEGLEQDLDAPRFEALLAHHFGEAAPDALQEDDGGEDAAAATDDTPGVLVLPEFGQSLWFTDLTGRGGQGMSTLGLPQDEQFEALFGFGAGVAGADE